MDFSTVAVIGAFLGMLFGIWKIARDFREDLTRTTQLLFKRFDAHKDAVDLKILHQNEASEAKFMRQDLCNKTSGSIEAELKRMNTKLDLLLGERRQ